MGKSFQWQDLDGDEIGQRWLRAVAQPDSQHRRASLGHGDLRLDLADGPHGRAPPFASQQNRITDDDRSDHIGKPLASAIAVVTACGCARQVLQPQPFQHLNA